MAWFVFLRLEEHLDYNTIEPCYLWHNITLSLFIFDTVRLIPAVETVRKRFYSIPQFFRLDRKSLFLLFRDFWTQTSPIIIHHCGQTLRFIHPMRIIPCLYHDRLADRARTIWLIRYPTADGTDIFIPPKQMCFPCPESFLHFYHPKLMRALLLLRYRLKQAYRNSL